MDINKEQIIQIELDGEIICSKPLFLNDNLISIREKIKNRINSSFLFLNKDENEIIDKEDEIYFLLKDIIIGNIIKLTGKSLINLFLNNTKISCLMIQKSDDLKELRNLLINKIKFDFIFLDNSENEIDINDENKILIKEILKGDRINLKFNNKEDENAIDFSKYEILERKEDDDDLTLYKYSNKEYKSKEKLVYQHFYDEFSIHDFNNAYVVLFCGKTGDGKTTAINAFFNIIKGIKLEDNYRFILIEEKKKKKDRLNPRLTAFIYII